MDRNHCPRHSRSDSSHLRSTILPLPAVAVGAGLMLMLMLTLLPRAAFSQAPAQIPGPGDETPSVTLQFPSNPLEEVLLIYQELTNLQIIRDANVAGATVSILTNDKLTRKDAAIFIEKSLLFNGFAFVPAGKNTVKIIAFSGGKLPRQERTPFFSRVEDLPETEQVVNYFMPLTYITTEEAVRTFTLMIPNHVYGVVVPVPNAQAVIISENSETIRSLVELKEFVDVPPAQVLNKSIQLERSDAEEVAAILTELLGTQQDSGSSGGAAARPVATQARAQGGQPGAAGVPQINLSLAGGGGGGASTSESVQPTIVPIARTNRILVIARPIDMTYIEGLIKEFDAPADVRNFLKRKLNYMRVGDFLTIASDALSRGQEEGGVGATGGALGQGRTTTTRQPAGQVGGGGATGGGGGSTLGASSTLAAEDLGGPESLVIGKTLIIADSQANTLIVSGPPENLRIITELLDELDLRSSQIYLSTVIGQLTLGDNLDWSVDVLRTFAQEGEHGGAGLFRSGAGENAAAILDPTLLTDATTLPVLSGLSLYGTFGGHLNTYVRALESTNRFTVLSRPSIFVRNNKKASIRSGQRIAVPTSTLTSLDTGVATPSVQASIQFEEVVLELEVVPLINSDDEVTLQIVQVNDNVIGTQVVGGNEVPIISTQVLETEVTIPDQSTVILGGLISEDVDDTKTGFPLLIHVPILKHVFGSTSKEKSRSELLIFIQPQIVNSSTDLVDANVDITRRTEVAEDVLDFAITEPPIAPTEIRGDVGVEETEMDQAWRDELARRRGETEGKKKKGLFKGRFDSEKKTSVPGKRRPF